MTPVWAQRREALLSDCLVSPDVFNRVCPTFYTHGSSGIRGPFSINAAMSMDKYFIA